MTAAWNLPTGIEAINRMAAFWRERCLPVMHQHTPPNPNEKPPVEVPQPNPVPVQDPIPHQVPPQQAHASALVALVT